MKSEGLVMILCVIEMKDFHIPVLESVTEQAKDVFSQPVKVSDDLRCIVRERKMGQIESIHRYERKKTTNKRVRDVVGTWGQS